jgi:HPt (histidine-containing phosphotransfer) domain-containing protein
MISVSDKEKILEELGGLPVEIYDELVAEHFALVKKKVHELNDLLGQCNYEEFRKVAHYIKSSSANLRLTPFQELGLEMENASREAVDRDTLIQSMDKLEKLIERVEVEGLP